MITLLHGQDLSQTQKELDLLKNSFPQGTILTLDPAKLTPEQVYQSLTSSGLFNSTTAIIIDEHGAYDGFRLRGYGQRPRQVH